MTPQGICERMRREDDPEWIKTEINYIRMCKEPLHDILQVKNDKRQAEKTCRERAPHFELNSGMPFLDFLVSFESAIARELEDWIIKLSTACSTSLQGHMPGGTPG